MISTLQELSVKKPRVAVKPATRIHSIDILRGAVMLIMALDHARHIFHTPAMIDEPTNLATTTPALFFTRWITHFCAPVFLFLSGISAYISGQTRSKSELSAFLIKRGLWLLVVEIAIVTLAITFNPSYDFFILQVIWAIGCSMIILGLLVRTSLPVIIAAAVIIFLGHNVLDYIELPTEGVASVFWNVFFTSPGKFYPVGGGKVIAVLYTILPWTAIMLAGFALGQLYRADYSSAERKRILLWSGIAVTAVFVTLRLMNNYGDPAPWSEQKNGIYTFLSFLNVTKYPVSLQYSCMTLGPALIILAITERTKAKFSEMIMVFGRVPFFYYVCHFYLLHLMCVVLFFASGYGWDQVVDKNSFMFFRPLQFGVGLLAVYLIWLLAIVLLYWPCKWFSNYKKTHRQWWLSYI
ncbi:MAG TPA: heparan-alpha-glucosaminide N-acetyltransferase domain-containing protein [Flavitalea sp.]|nr:heparan-alpha-glucosaminide N-acetyltransferase domain-containing protein [Flavitalea sp.]